MSKFIETIFPWIKEKKQNQLHQVLVLYALVFLVWGAYRVFLPPANEWLEEIFLKGAVFGLPVIGVVLWVEKKTLSSLGMTTKGLLVAMYFGLLFGLWLAVLGNVVSFLRDGGISFNTQLGVVDFGNLMILGLITAFWEQLMFSGYMLPRLVRDLDGELVGVVLMALAFAVIHVPVQVAAGVSLVQMLIRFVLLFSLGFGNGVMYLRLKNLAAPIFAHLAWGSVIYLFG